MSMNFAAKGTINYVIFTYTILDICYIYYKTCIGFQFSSLLSINIKKRKKYAEY